MIYDSATVEVRMLEAALANSEILVVEDCDDMWQLVSIYLRRAGAIVERAVNGEEAVRKALAREYEAILMDIQMPQMDGLEATSRLRAGGYKRPILALTTGRTAAEISRAITAGCNGHLGKPCFGHALISEVAKHCD